MEGRMIQCGPSSSSSTKWKHNVFVSFRGEDIRNTFADHLFGAFEREGIGYVFRDNRDIRPGDHISTELMQAIEGSQVLIPVFSKNYANSTWCLRELAKIVDCKNREAPTGQRVLPVFYDVSPSEVRKQSGNYAKAFADHKDRFKNDLEMVQSWRKALKEVADLSGSSDVQNKPQYEEIQKIVERVKDLLDPELSGLDGLVGMKSRVEQLEELLAIDSNDGVRVVGVCGMGGIGKTTLATKVYERNFHKYDGSCFIDEVRKVYSNGGLIAVQKQLIYQTLRKEETRDIWNIPEATCLINTRLCHRKALIVLDDVDKNDQLEKLGLNRERLCTGSRIIITSRDRQILSNYGVDDIYDAELLSYKEARQLFCKKAFKHNPEMSSDAINTKEYEVLIGRALEYAKGLPLAIEVLGSHLHGRNISEWKDALDRLKDNPQRGIMDVLEISFDGLEPEEKEIFLDIACFFKSYDISDLRKMLEYRGFHPEIGIRVLIDKSLIIDENGVIKMHDMLQELGMKIIHEHDAPKEPGKRSRIWRCKDFQCLMFENMAMNNIEVIMLFPRIDDMDDTQANTSSLRADALSKMNQLRLLVIRNVEFSGSLNHLSKELRYLEWNFYPFTYFPSSCELNNLVELHLRFSSIRQLWKGIKPLDKLRYMNLNFSKNLVRISDLSGAPNLRELNLEGCTNLEEIHPSIGDLRNLVRLNLRDCMSLTSLPNSIFNATSLIHVNLEGCSKAFQSQLSENAGHIGTSNTTFQWKLSASSLFKKIKLMLPFPLDDFTRRNDIAGSQMPSLARCYCLRYLNLSYCSLVNIPESLASLCCLHELILEGNNFVELPSFMAKLPRLVLLRLNHCKQLASISEFPLRVDFQVEDSNSVNISFFECPELVEMESLSSSALSCMLRVLMVHKESSPEITIIAPGTQIPSWFNRQSVGDSISLGPFPNVHDSNWIGMAFCATFIAHFGSFEYQPGNRITIQCFFENGHRNFLWRTLIDGQGRNGLTTGLVHLCLLHFTRQELTDEFIKMENENKDSDTINFRFVRSQFLASQGVGFEVKNCGVRVVYKQDLEEFVRG